MKNRNKKSVFIAFDVEGETSMGKPFNTNNKRNQINILLLYIKN